MFHPEVNLWIFRFRGRRRRRAGRVDAEAKGAPMATKPTTAEDIEAVMTIVDRTDVRSTMTGLVRLENILGAQREYAHLIDCANNVLTDPHASPSQVAVATAMRGHGLRHLGFSDIA